MRSSKIVSETIAKSIPTTVCIKEILSKVLN